MASGDVATGMIILLQMTVGILGNFCLLHHYLFLYYTGCRWRNTDLIFKHLVVANILVILSKGVPQTLAVLGLKDFLGDIGCKLVFYVHRVSRDVSIGTICLLSVFQVITISPRNSKWAELKVKAPKYLGTSTIFCWVLNMMLNITVPVYITGKWSNKNTTKKHNYGYCYTLHYENITDSLHVALILLHDGFCLGLMIWSSGSMVFILHRHKEQTIVGILENFCLLYHHLFFYMTGYRLRSTDSILKHLTLANLLVILSKGFSQMMVSLGVNKDVSVGTTCYLSVFQAMTISSRNSRWEEHKVKPPKCIGISNIFRWTVKRSNTSITRKRDYGYCYFVTHGNITQSLHKQQVQYIHKNNLSARSLFETRAIQSIFIVLIVFHNSSVCLVNTSTLIAACFPSVGPSILMSHDSRLSGLCFAGKKNINSPKLIINL
ncbi:hypothetical protein HPG69_007582 [Diceros bicornis minor]|uniref:Vomeronasal type-1 receptor n=1 Tax=Diceros bicornis minor TaxID=77932 RepID=A0A7J7EG33_DICBM|nr:hypothetical protein HPG69_007582 [Diceros bicornis minor]